MVDTCVRFVKLLDSTFPRAYLFECEECLRIVGRLAFLFASALVRLSRPALGCLIQGLACVAQPAHNLNVDTVSTQEARAPRAAPERLRTRDSTLGSQSRAWKGCSVLCTLAIRPDKRM